MPCDAGTGGSFKLLFFLTPTLHPSLEAGILLTFIAAMMLSGPGFADKGNLEEKGKSKGDREVKSVVSSTCVRGV